VPIYTYACTSCNSMVEKRQSFSDAPLTTCDECGGTLRKVIHPVGIVFKGSGWYVTDSRKSSSSSVNGTGESGEKTDKKSDSETKPAESKSDTTASSAAPASSSEKKPAATTAAPAAKE
jgi:putative FmdB family regulatory protein